MSVLCLQLVALPQVAQKNQQMQVQVKVETVETYSLKSKSSAFTIILQENTEALSANCIKSVQTKFK